MISFNPLANANILDVNKQNNLEVNFFSKLKLPLDKLLSKFVGEKTSEYVFSKRLTNSGKQAEHCLKSNLVQSYIMSGEEGVRKLFYPFLDTYLKDVEINTKDKMNMIEQIKNDIKTCERLIKNEFQDDYIKCGNEGIEFTKKTINDVVKPYKVI